MEQEKLYVIEEKTYEAHIDEEVHLYGCFISLPSLPEKSRTGGCGGVHCGGEAVRPDRR